MQTLANAFRRNPRDRLSGERRLFPLNDGTGDTLLGMLETPTESTGKPLVIVIHGLAGAEDSIYVLSVTSPLLREGYRVLRLNLRGAGASRATCSDQYCAASSRDLKSVLDQLPDDLKCHGVVAVAYSLGGAMLLKYLGEEGSRTPLLAAATVCAPIDLARSGKNMLRLRNYFYHHSVLSLMKRNAKAEGSALSRTHRAALLRSRNIWEYDDTFVAPQHGFAGAEDYYTNVQPLRFLGEIRIPTLVLAACDDPWVPVEMYREYDFAGNDALIPVITKTGGHVGYHAAGSKRPWSDRTVCEFFDRVCAPATGRGLPG